MPSPRRPVRPAFAAALARRLGPIDATAIVVSGIIGAGIFVNPYVVARLLGTPVLVLSAWIVGGLVALAGAFVFAELGAVLPRAGGQYAYFREAFGPLPAFLHGWSMLLLVQSASTAAVAIVLGEHLVRLTGLPDGAVRPLAAGVILALVAFHSLGVRPGAVLIDAVTIGKTVALVALVLVALAAAGPSGLTLSPAVPTGASGPSLVSAFFAALVPVMFAYGGWQNLNYVAEEVVDARRNVPRALIAGVGLCIAVYLGANVAYVHALGVRDLAASRTPAADMAGRVLGPWGGAVVGALIVVSAFGFLVLSLLAAPRVYYAMGRDGVFFAAAGRTGRFGAPTAAIAVQGCAAAALALARGYEALLGWSVFADWIFFALAGLAVPVLRRRLPDAPRPWSMPLGMAMPVLFALAGAGIVANLFVTHRNDALAGSAMVLAGVPAYALWARKRPGTRASADPRA